MGHAELPLVSVPIEGSTHRITTAEYERMVSAGMFEGRRLELLDGRLVDQMTQDELHVLIIRRLMNLFAARMDLLRVQFPLAVGEGWVPEPDVALEAHPAGPPTRPTTALLVVEVSLSSRERDLYKADAYAAAAIPRYWLVDVERGCVLEHTEPSNHGYGLVRRLMGDDVLAAQIEGVPTITVAELLAEQTLVDR